MRLLSVVLGARSSQSRASESQKLLSWGFRYYMTHKLYEAGEQLATSEVWKGTTRELNLGLVDEVYLTIPRGAEDLLDAQLAISPILEAPIEKGQQLGTMTVNYQGEEILSRPVVALNAVEEAGFFQRLWDSLKLFVLGLLGSL